MRLKRQIQTILNCTLLFISLGNTAIGDDATIAAAANLQFALPLIAQRFTDETSRELNIVYGSSGNFTRQIRQGAPFDLFISADDSYIENLHADGLTKDIGKIYAQGRIALATSKSPSDVTVEKSSSNPLLQVKQLLANGKIERFAIANPVHAPYGVRAQQALQYAQLWQPLKHLLVYGENVAQAAQFALSSNTQGGIIAYSLARAPMLADKGNFYLIPANFHEPLLQRMILLKHDNATAQAFYRFMQSTWTQQTLEDFGFDQPDAPR